MIEFADGLQVALFIAVIHMTLLYFLSLFRKDASIVDIGWGLGFVIMAWVLKYLADEKEIGFYLVVLFVSIWGLRLGWHIYRRKARKPEEDWRYQQMRENWGANFVWQSYFKIFMLQAGLSVLAAMPLIIAAQASSEFTTSSWLYIGSVMWLVGFYFESVGDRQLEQFLIKKAKSKKKKKSKQLMTKGLWAYTRHPNYFGEVTQWWGIFVMTIGLSNFWWGLIGPLTITYLLLVVSGIPMLEKKYQGNKEFERYKSQTNAFFPGPRKTKTK